MIDQKIIIIVSIIISVKGLIGAITKYSNRRKNVTFFSRNLYNDKSDIIDGYVTWIFTGIGAIGLLLPIIPIIWWKQIEVEIYGCSDYGYFTIICICAAILNTILLLRFCRYLAKKKWRPEIVNCLKEDKLSIEQRIKEIKDKNELEMFIKRYEELLDIKNIKKELIDERVTRLMRILN